MNVCVYKTLSTCLQNDLYLHWIIPAVLLSPQYLIQDEKQSPQFSLRWCENVEVSTQINRRGGGGSHRNPVGSKSWP